MPDRNATGSDRSDDAGKGVAKAAPAPAKSKGSRVKNLHTSPIQVGYVTIEPGDTAEVPDLDQKNSVIKAWIDGKVISVS